MVVTTKMNTTTASSMYFMVLFRDDSRGLFRLVEYGRKELVDVANDTTGSLFVGGRVVRSVQTCEKQSLDSIQKGVGLVGVGE